MTKKKQTSDERRAKLTGSIFAAAQAADRPSAKRSESPSIVGAALGAHTEGLSSEIDRLRAERDAALASGHVLVELNPNSVRDALPRDRIDAAFADEDFHALLESIQKDGQFIPITVRQVGKDSYEIAAGRRRLEACKRLNVPVLARMQELDDTQMLQLQYEENEQRAGISSFERARWYQAVQERYEMTTPDLAKRFGVSQPMIVKYLKLARLPEEIIEALDDPRDISVGDSEKLNKALNAGSPADLVRRAIAAKGSGTKAQIRAMLAAKSPSAVKAKSTVVRKGKNKLAEISTSGRKFEMTLESDFDAVTRKQLIDGMSELLTRIL